MFPSFGHWIRAGLDINEDSMQFFFTEILENRRFSPLSGEALGHLRVFNTHVIEVLQYLTQAPNLDIYIPFSAQEFFLRE